MTKSDLRYTKDHEWACVESDGIARIGISNYAQEQLGDVVFIELPAVGAKIQQSKKLGEIESVKAVSDLYAPISGEVVEINQRVVETPELVNEDPYEAGWLLRIKIESSSEMDILLSSQEYDDFLATQD
jgi:glycine cleavage system H protein